MVVLVTAPVERADALADTLVAERLAACVNLLPGVRSVYRWEGAVVREAEALLVVKTTRDLVETLRRRLVEIHPYEVFELIALDVSAGSAAYLAWLAGAVRDAPGRP